MKQTPLGYLALRHEIENAPITWLPALLITTIKQCIKRKVYAHKDAMLEAIRRTVENEH